MSLFSDHERTNADLTYVVLSNVVAQLLEAILTWLIQT